MTTGAIVTCPHGGPGTSTSLTPIFTIAGQTALAENDTGVLACPLLVYPCVGYTLRSMGLNESTIAGRKAILETDFQLSLTGLPLTITETQQVFDDRTPPPGSGGGAGAPGAMPPALLDVSRPVVSAVPPMLAFDSTTQLPPTLAVAFTLAHAHPLEWQLRLINPVMRYDRVLTDGTTPGAAVFPAGGDWSTPSLTVTLTMTAVFMAALGKTPTTPHEFYMTGISRRGVSAYAVARLAIT